VKAAVGGAQAVVTAAVDATAIKERRLDESFIFAFEILV
jgi:hypothetical protein